MPRLISTSALRFNSGVAGSPGLNECAGGLRIGLSLVWSGLSAHLVWLRVRAVCVSASVWSGLVCSPGLAQSAGGLRVGLSLASQLVCQCEK